MEYTTLGRTGTTISRLGLGCMSFGSSSWRDWVLDEAESRAIIERAIDLGINFFDTANLYSLGESERILGSVLADRDRNWAVVATKVFHRMDGDNPNSGGLSRKAIEQELRRSLDRLNMDTVDLYQIHKWDYDTPIEETLSTLDDAVRRGQVRYLGASKMWAYQFASALETADRLGLDRFVSMQNHYNLVYREDERELLPLCSREGIGAIPFSPLARGYLTRPDGEFLETSRGKYMESNGKLADRVDHYRSNGGSEINGRLEELADQYDASMAQIALAWLLHRDVVDAPIIGTTSVDHLEAAVAALDIRLSDRDLDWLEAPYRPKSISGHE